MSASPTRWKTRLARTALIGAPLLVAMLQCRHYWPPRIPFNPPGDLPLAYLPNPDMGKGAEVHFLKFKLDFDPHSRLRLNYQANGREHAIEINLRSTEGRYHVLRLPLVCGPITSLRLTPITTAGRARVRDFQLVDREDRPVREMPATAWSAADTNHCRLRASSEWDIQMTGGNGSAELRFEGAYPIRNPQRREPWDWPRRLKNSSYVALLLVPLFVALPARDKRDESARIAAWAIPIGAALILALFMGAICLL